MKLRISTLVLVTVLHSWGAMADVKPAQLFMDHMVIQRETKAPVWGTAAAGEQVTVTGSWGASASVVTGEDGKWSVKLQTPAAGGPHTIALKGNNRVELKNVLAGDVWLCTGQSNMERRVAKSKNPDEEINNAKYPQIRNFTVVFKPSLEELDDCGGEWTGNLVCLNEAQIELHLVVDLRVGSKNPKGLSVLGTGHSHGAELLSQTHRCRPGAELTLYGAVGLIILRQHLEARTRPNRVVGKGQNNPASVAVVGDLITGAVTECLPDLRTGS